MMPLHLRLVLAVVVAAPLGAQTSADSAHAKTIRAAVDTIRRAYPNTLRQAPTLARLVNRVDSIELARLTPKPLPPAPVARDTIVCTGLTCALDGRASTGVRLTYVWKLGASADAVTELTATGVITNFAYPHSGDRTVILTVTDSLGRTSSVTKTFSLTAPTVPVDSARPPPVVVVPPPVIPPPVVTPPLDTTIMIVTAIAPELPRATPAFTIPAATRSYRIGTDLQRALDTAKVGDELRLTGVYVGNFVKRRCGNGWVTLRTNAADSLLPAAGQRITPRSAALLPAIQTATNQPALRVYGCNVRLFGLEITAAPGSSLRGVSVNYGLLALGDGGDVGSGETQTTLASVPQNIVVDRVYLHGQDSTNTVRCLALNSGATIVRESWISDCHAQGFDSQAIEGWNGPGPYLIENNEIQGAGENIMFGGADPGIPLLSPSDITIRRNHVSKDPRWKGVWSVKNLFELKNARRVLVEGNVFENNWADGQSGMAIVIKSTTDACGVRCLWEGSTDFTFRYNVVRNSPRGFNAQAFDNSYSPAGSDVHVARVRVEHNLWENIGTYNGTGADGWLVLLTHDLTDIAFLHNTCIGNLPNAGQALVMDYGGGAAKRLELNDNVFAGQLYYAIFYSGMKVGVTSLQAMAGSSWSFARNVVANVDPEYAPWHPQTSWYPATRAAVGFAADWSLGARSPYKGKALDGTDPGADIAELTRRTSGVVVTP